MMQRRGLLGGLLAAPAVIRSPGLLMAVRAQPLMVLLSFYAGVKLEYERLRSFDRKGEPPALLDWPLYAETLANPAVDRMAYRQIGGRDFIAEPAAIRLR